MSSILKALKKLENEEVLQHKVESLSAAVHTKKGKALSGRGFRTTLIFAGAAVVFISGGVIWKYAVNRPEAVVSSKPYESKIYKADSFIKPKLKQMKNLPVQGETSSKRQDKPNPAQMISSSLGTETTQQDHQLSTSLKNKNKMPERFVSGPPIKKSGQKRNNYPKNPGGQKQVDALEIPEPNISESDKKDRDKKNSAQIDVSGAEPKFEEERIEILEDSTIKLMAIAWSDDPQSRIAVINDRISREGDTVEGMTIYRINEEDVILRKGGRSWKLLFRLK